MSAEPGQGPVSPAYEVRSDRLVLRCFEARDVEPLHRAIEESLEHLRPFMAWSLEEPRGLEHKLQLVRRFRGRFDLGEDFAYAALDRADGAFVGGCGLHTRPGPGALEIGYWLHPGRTGRGLATELAAALTRVAFEVHRVERVEIRVQPDNAASARIAERLGYAREALLRRRLDWPDEPRRDLEVWTLFSDEYFASPAAGAVIEARDLLGRRLL